MLKRLLRGINSIKLFYITKYITILDLLTVISVYPWQNSFHRGPKQSKYKVKHDLKISIPKVLNFMLVY